MFRQYDIRGIVPDELSDSLMLDIARAFATHAIIKGHSKILLGRDNRLSSPQLRELALEAILDSGCDVIDLGMVVTPVFYFASRHLDIKAGIMITASHNPGEYNGCKLLLGDHTIFGEEIQNIRQRIERRDFFTGPRGKLETIDIIPDYIEMIKSKIKMGPNIAHLVVDCGNGTASTLAPQVFRSLGCEVSELYCDSDPSFPHHHPDPVNPKNMVDLVAEVKKTGADLGIGIDGDGDRLGVVDARGNMIWGDMLMILFWRDILPRYPGCECIVEVKCSQALIDEIERLGGKPLIYKTGHSLIKSKMKEINAVFTGEMSGHMFFADNYYGFDDALYAGARLLELLSHSEKNISEMLSDVPRYYSTPEIRIPVGDEEKFFIVDKVREHFKLKYPIIEIDGARILFPQGWGLVRASNTGPELIVRCEGRSPEALEQIKAELFGCLQSLGMEEEPGPAEFPFTPVYNYPKSEFQDQV
ncbi:phosphomannomutase/phosphoglucomutase [Syntrophomonas wolfei]|uniref:phosphomannomutase/phosphoglucomutase n=1 Tax=Syntrophomonas wolfei TaxID=863 RepID=UPI002287572C|nr:phosphomannomutase/phosphoglucomutase [Syntrophomonas wolfei]